MSKTLRASLGFLVFLISSTSTFLLLSRCGSGDGPAGEGEDYTYSYSGSYDAPAASGTNLLDTTVSFTLSWNQNGDQIQGEYKDDHFATTAAPVTGTVSAGVRTMEITLGNAVDGVVSFVVTTSKAEGQLSETFDIASLLARSPGGATVFKKDGVKVTAIKTSAPSTQTSTTTQTGPVPEGAAGAFFAEIAKDYDYFAKNTNAVDDGSTWTHGEKVKISVGKDGVVTITGKNIVLLKYGSNAKDSYEKYDHEDYATFIVDDKTRFLAQRQAASGEIFFNYQTQGGAFWHFQATDPGNIPSKWGTLGLEYVTGTYKHKVTYATPQGESTHPLGSPVEITIDAKAKVTGTFGEFAYVDENETPVIQSSTNGVQGATVYYYRPDQKTYPRSVLEMKYESEKWVSARCYYQEVANQDAKSWVVDTKSK